MPNFANYANDNDNDNDDNNTLAERTCSLTWAQIGLF